MKNFILNSILISHAVFLVFGCKSKYTSATKLLSEKQRAGAAASAVSGDLEAAITLYDHYAFGEGQPFEGIEWLVLSVRLGDKDAAGELSGYVQSGELENYLKGLLSLEESDSLDNSALNSPETIEITIDSEEYRVDYLPLLEQAVIGGSKEAAMLIFEYYVRIHDSENADKWLETAAKMGSRNAIQLMEN